MLPQDVQATSLQIEGSNPILIWIYHNLSFLDGTP